MSIDIDSIINKHINDFVATKKQELLLFKKVESIDNLDVVSLVKLQERYQIKLDTVKKINTTPPNKDFGEKVHEYYNSLINTYKKECIRYKDITQNKIDSLEEVKHKRIIKKKSEIEDEKKRQLEKLKPMIDLHNSLLSKKSELESLFNLYHIRSNDYEVDFGTMEFDELKELTELSLYAIDSVTRNSNIFNSMCKLLYLPLTVHMKDEVTNIIFNIVWFISEVLLLKLCKPAVALFSICYLITIVSNLRKIEQRKDILQMAYAMMVDIDFSEYVESLPEVMEIMSELQEIESMDLSDNIDLINEEYKDMIAKLDDPSVDMDSDLAMLAVKISDGEIQAKLAEAEIQLNTDKNNTISILNKQLQSINNKIESLPKQLLGDDIINTDLLSLNMKLGVIKNNNEPVAEVGVDIPMKSMGFLYKDEASRKDVLNYMKLMLTNYICNVNIKRMNVTIFDPVGLGGEMTDFINNRTLDYISIVTGDFAKVLENARSTVKNNINQFGATDLNAYNKSALEEDKVTLKYELLIIMSGVKIDENEQVMDLIRSKAETGVITLFLYKDESLAKDDEKKNLESVYSKILISKSYGSLIDMETGKEYGTVNKPAEPYIYNSSLGKKVINKYEELLGVRKDPFLEYESKYQKRHIPREKFWTYNTLRGIEAHFGYLDGDPTKNVAHAFGDDTPHAITVGKTGSGKTAFIYNALSTMLLMYSPEWLTLGLVDFKNISFPVFKGKYAIPHAKFIAGTEDGEYALSLFEYMDKEMARRNAIFKKYNTTNIIEYNTGVMNGNIKDKIMPRMLFLIDEFQVMYNKVAKSSLAKIESAIISLSKVGRTAGCHLWFASQSMAGTMSNDVMEQFALRVALGCSADLSNTILGNPAAASIDRKGYAYTNDSGGEMATANRFWRVPYLATETFFDYIVELNKKCVDENIEHRVYKVFDEDEKFDKDTQIQRMAMEEIAKDHSRFVLGERTQFSVNKYPPTLKFFNKDNENLMMATYDTNAYLNLINSMLVNLNYKGDIDIAIHSSDEDILTLLNAKDKITKGYEFLLGRDITVEMLFQVLETAIDNRENHPEKTFRDLYFFGLMWEMLDGFGDSMKLKEETRFKKILSKGPRYGIHVILCSKSLENLISFKTSFIHKIGSKLDSKSNNVIEPNDKLQGKDFKNHLAIYTANDIEIKFKIYQHAIEGVVEQRDLIQEVFD